MRLWIFLIFLFIYLFAIFQGFYNEYKLKLLKVIMRKKGKLLGNVFNTSYAEGVTLLSEDSVALESDCPGLQSGSSTKLLCDLRPVT